MADVPTPDAPEPSPPRPASPDRPRRRVLPVPGVVDLDAIGDEGSPAAPVVSDEVPLPAREASADLPPANVVADAVADALTDAPAETITPAPDLTGDLPEDAADAGEPTTPPETGAPTPADRSTAITDLFAMTPADATAVVVPPPAVPASVVPAAVEEAKEATRSRGRELVALVLRYGRAHVPARAPRAPAPDSGPPRYAGRLGVVLPVLQVIPWILAVLFAASFVWDTPTGLLRVLTVSGLIGFGTNWLAITMLFQPREKRAVIPQGLIPAQRERVIYRLSEAISRELINADIIKQRIQASGVIGRYRDLALGVVRGVVEDPGFRSDLKGIATDYASEVLGSEGVRRELARVAVEKVEQQAGQGLGGMALRLYRTFAEDDFQRRVDRALAELPQAIVPLLDRVDAALDAVPARVEAHADEIEDVATRAVLSFVEGLDVRTMIAEKARTFDEAQLEGLLKSTSNEQLRYIQYLGAVLGVVGGFVIWRPVEALVLLAALTLGLWALDEALVRARRRRVRGMDA